MSTVFSKHITSLLVFVLMLSASCFIAASEMSSTVSNVQEHVNHAYKQAAYVISVLILLGIVIIRLHIKQLKNQKDAQHRIEQALAVAEAARAEAERSAQAKITFLARMSHEIRTPMNGVLGMAEALAFTPLDEKQSELLDTLQGSAKNLLALLNDILDFSKMDAGKLTLESVPVDFKALAHNVIASFGHNSVNPRVKLTCHLDDSIKPFYLSDPTRLTQVLNNLISNALKFTKKGRIDLSMKIVEQQIVDGICYDTIKIAVLDTGIGIAKDKQDLLFTPFIQADNDTTRKFGGTGLGLSICQEIVNAMGGKITLESAKGAGSLFHFTLTYKQSDFIADSADRRKQHRLVNLHQGEQFNGIRVLVAEDNLVNVTVISAQLERLNIKPDIAENGKKALAMHQEDPYDIIISDCHMPKMNGYELAHALTQAPSARALWLIAVTADALSGSAEKCLAAGFDDYMAKPCPQEEIDNKLYHAYRQLMRRRSSIALTSNTSFAFTLFKPQLLLKENDHDIVLTKSFASIFVESWGQDKAQLLKAITTHDYAKIHAITHKCKGGIRYLCGNAIDELALQLERYAQAQNKSKTEQHAKAFMQQLDTLAQEVQQWLASIEYA